MHMISTINHSSPSHFLIGRRNDTHKLQPPFGLKLRSNRISDMIREKRKESDSLSAEFLPMSAVLPAVAIISGC